MLPHFSFRPPLQNFEVLFICFSFPCIWILFPKCLFASNFLVFLFQGQFSYSLTLQMEKASFFE